MKLEQDLKMAEADGLFQLQKTDSEEKSLRDKAKFEARTLRDKAEFEAKTLRDKIEMEARTAEIEAKTLRDKTEMEARTAEIEAKILRDNYELDTRIARDQAENEARILAIRIESDLKQQSVFNQISLDKEKTAHEIENLENSVSMTNIPSVTQSQNSQGIKNISNIPCLKTSNREEIELYLSHFSKACALNDIPVQNRSKLLYSKLPLELSAIIDRLSIEEASDFDEVQKAIFRKFLINGDYFKNKFYGLTQSEGESSSQFFARLREIFDKWLAAEKISQEYERLVDFTLKNQYIRKLTTEKAIFIKERTPNSLADLCQVADIYDLAHLNANNRPKFQGHNSYNAWNSKVQTGKPEEGATNKFFKPQANKPKEVVVCTFCSKPGHSENSCYAKFGKPTHIRAGPQESSTPLKPSRKPGKTGPHPTAAMYVVDPPNYNHLTFVNSNFKDKVVSPSQLLGGLESKILESSEVSMLDLSEEDTPIMAAYTVQNSCPSFNGENKLNPYSEALILPSKTPVRCMRDTGSFTSVVKKDLIPDIPLTHRRVKVQFANGAIDSFPTAVIEIQSRFYSGRLEVAVMEFPVADLILGNQPGINTNFDPVGDNISITKHRKNKSSNDSNEMSNLKHKASLTDNQVETFQSANSELESKLTSSLKQNVNKDFLIQNEIKSKIVELNKTNIPEQVIPGRCLSFVNSKLLNAENIAFQTVNEQVSLSCNESPVFQTEIENFSGEQMSNPLNQNIATDTGIPVGAIMTRSKARTLDDIRLPNISVEIPDLSVDKVREMQKNDPSLSRYWGIADGSIVREKNKYTDEFFIKNEMLYRKNFNPKGLDEAGYSQWVIPRALLQTVFKTCHESTLGCHLGSKKTLDRIQRCFWCPNLHTLTTRFCQSCHICQLTSKQGSVPKSPMLISKLADQPFEHLAMDLCGEIIPPSSQGHKYILTIICCSSRYPEAIPLKKIDTKINN